MIRRCSVEDAPVIAQIINDAARRYQGAIPADCWHEPYMTLAQLTSEIDAGVEFWGWDDGRGLMGVMGMQDVKDATLIRHAYVRTQAQGGGIGSALMQALVPKAKPRLLVGTWAAAAWAIRFYEGHHFRLVGEEEKSRLLSTYWSIPDRQRETSVVLAHEGRISR